MSLLPLLLAATAPTDLLVKPPASSIPGIDASTTLIDLLSRAATILLYGVTPVVVVGVGLYIAYQLLTTEGDESKNKQAWKSLTYGAIGIISILLAYVVIKIALSVQL